MADIVLINPRFQVSYWGLEHALPLLGKKCNLPTACLPLLAALTPAGHSVTIVDENVEPIDYDRLAQADIVGLTGMTVQRARMLEILRELKTRDVFTIVGGPWVFLTRKFDWARTRNAYWVQTPGIAPDLSASDDHHAPPTPRPKLVVHLRDQVRDALPPLHNVPADGRTADAGEHVLAFYASRFLQPRQTL